MRKFIKAYTGDKNKLYYNIYKIISNINYYINILIIFYVLAFNAKRRIRSGVNNIKAKMEGINVDDAFRKRKRKFTIGTLNLIRTKDINKTIPAIKIKRILFTIY